MKIGVAREIKPDEYRVALTPAGARELGQRGHEVLVETGAGEGSSFPDDSYEGVGARVVTVDEVWEASELLLKVKEPVEQEYRRGKQLETGTGIRRFVAGIEGRKSGDHDSVT